VSSFAFSSQVIATLASGVSDNYAPAGYVPGTTNCLILTPTDATSALAGLVATGIANGYPLLIRNASDTVAMTFFYEAGSSAPANQFSCPNNGSVSLDPSSNVMVVYLGGQWTL